MSLMICPDCGKECSTEAVACPNCAHPFVERETVIRQPVVEKIGAPVAPRRVVVAEVPREKSFPNWMFAPIAIVLVVLVFAIIYMMRDTRQDEAQNNVNVRIRETAATGNSRTTTSTVPQTVNPAQSADSTVTVAPPSQSSSTTTTVPSNLPPSSSSSTVSNLPPAGSSTVATEAVAASDKGALKVKASIMSSKGIAQPVKAEKFYLLDKDLESILSKAGIQLEAGDYASTLGAAIADPNRKDLLQQCLAAIKPHIIASTQTDGSGAAQFKGVKPDSYYIFGVHKTGNSASVWNTMININAGDNSIDLNGSAPSPSNTGGLTNSGY